MQNNLINFPFLKVINQHLPSDLFDGFKGPFQGLSDLHLGDQRVTWKKLEVGFSCLCLFTREKGTPNSGTGPYSHTTHYSLRFTTPILPPFGVRWNFPGPRFQKYGVKQ